MKIKRKKIIPPKKEYLEKAESLSKNDAEFLMSRMGGKLTRRLEDKELSAIEVVALQLELEDEQLRAWRKTVADMRGNGAANCETSASHFYERTDPSHAVTQTI